MADLGIELELGVLLAVMLVGTEIFAPFEIETPAWRKILKFSIVIAATLILYRYVSHWALLVPLVLGGFGLTVHFVWCRKNAIHPVRATPRRRYYELRGWKWHE